MTATATTITYGQFTKLLALALKHALRLTLYWARIMGPITWALLAFKVFLGFSSWYVYNDELEARWSDGWKEAEKARKTGKKPF
jgi:hypothetical protein